MLAGSSTAVGRVCLAFFFLRFYQVLYLALAGSHPTTLVPDSLYKYQMSVSIEADAKLLRSRWAR